MFDRAKKVWTVLGTFGIVKPVGLLTIGVLASGGVEAGAREAAPVLHWVFGLLAGLAGVGAAVLTYVIRRERVGFGWIWLNQPEPKPAPEPVVEPEPWTYTVEVVRATPSAIDPPRVFIAGQVITSERVEHA